MVGSNSTTRIVKYESKTRSVVDTSQISGTFSIQIKKVKRDFVRLSGEEENCREYVANALSETIIDKWIQASILPEICKEAIELGGSSTHRGGGFSVEAQVEAVKENYFTDFVDLNDYDSQGRRIPTEPDCPICLQEFGTNTTTIITKLSCCGHTFHRVCILPWLHRTPSCPICRDDVQNPRPKIHKPKIFYGPNCVITNY
ncbi:hypothetical protein HA466_0303280 [Hirschfeldia incana]|nr:hypothetical protein HA466_0303280 [Hirschfeldia incana]KAJ0230941.1 hypothetical protein HA466_0303280 [Hirschfeldia incana]